MIYNIFSINNINWSLFATKMKKGKISGKDNGQFKEDKSRERNIRGRKEI